jgi:hypothetical protein
LQNAIPVESQTCPTVTVPLAMPPPHEIVNKPSATKIVGRPSMRPVQHDRARGSSAPRHGVAGYFWRGTRSMVAARHRGQNGPSAER